MLHGPSKKPPLLVIVGETASGKSALALALAEQFNGELICSDSWTVYKDFDIGTAKPSAAEQQRIKHHLLDIADPAVGFSAVEFQKRAQAVIDDISGRGKLPIMVGGTGLYIDSVLYGYQFLPAPATGVREALEAQTLEELVRKAEAMGLDTTGIDLRNKRRVIRLIENNGVRPTRGTIHDNTLVLGIAVDREHLRERITRRVDAMLAAGLEDEVKRLAGRYGWDAEPMKGIGYREWQLYFEGEDAQTKQSLEQTRERIISASMGLAKRQRTWFKRNDCIHWLQLPNTETTAVAYTTTFLHG
jgi:tRNA dimethylallyltransferase